MKFWKWTQKKSEGHVLFNPLEKRAEIGDCTSVLQVALSNKIPIGHECDGMGTCTTCRIFVQSDLANVSKRTELEKEMADERNFADNERLSCQLEPHDGLIVEIPNFSKDSSI